MQKDGVRLCRQDTRWEGQPGRSAAPVCKLGREEAEAEMGLELDEEPRRREFLPQARGSRRGWSRERSPQGAGQVREGGQTRRGVSPQAAHRGSEGQKPGWLGAGILVPWGSHVIVPIGHREASGSPHGRSQRAPQPLAPWALLPTSRWGTRVQGLHLCSPGTTHGCAEGHRRELLLEPKDPTPESWGTPHFSLSPTPMPRLLLPITSSHPPPTPPALQAPGKCQKNHRIRVSPMWSVLDSSRALALRAATWIAAPP